jgi:2'-5' RNA ligase
LVLWLYMKEFPEDTQKREIPKSKIDIGIAFLLDKEISDKSFEIAEKLKNSDLEFIFSITEEKPPHISLFQGSVFKDEMKDIKKVVEALGDTLQEGLEIQMEPELYLNERNGNVFWNVKKSEQLQEIHEALLEKTAPITDGKVMAQFEKLLADPATPEETKERLKKYGAMLAGPYFLPHITIGRIKIEGMSMEEIKKIFETINIPKMSFKCYSKDIVSSEVDNFGRVIV